MPDSKASIRTRKYDPQKQNRQPYSTVLEFKHDNMQRKKMHVNISIIVKTVGRISLNDGGEVEEPESYNYFFVVFYVSEWKQISSCA